MSSTFSGIPTGPLPPKGYGSTSPFPTTPPPLGPGGTSPTPKKSRCSGRCLLIGIVLLVLALVACAVGYATLNSVYNFFGSGPGSSQTLPVGVSTATPVTPDLAATAFLTALEQGDYHQAYLDLDSTVTLDLLEDAFTQQAHRADTCFGRVTAFHLEHVIQLSSTSRQYTYSLKRSKRTSAYALKLVLDQNVDGNWTVSGYDTALVPPGAPPCAA